MASTIRVVLLDGKSGSDSSDRLRQRVLPIEFRIDDTVRVVREAVARSLKVPPTDLVFWSRTDGDTAAVVDALLNLIFSWDGDDDDGGGGGVPSTATRRARVSRSRIVAVHSWFCGADNHGGDRATSDDALLFDEVQAERFIADALGGVPTASLPVGARWTVDSSKDVSAWVPADPFSVAAAAAARRRPMDAGEGGGGEWQVDGEFLLLEEALLDVSRSVLYATTRASVPPGVAASELYFPPPDVFSSHAVDPSWLSRSFDDGVGSLLGAPDSARAPSHVRLSRSRHRIPLVRPLSLSEAFGSLAVSSTIPLASYFDGRGSRHKVFRRWSGDTSLLKQWLMLPVARHGQGRLVFYVKSPEGVAGGPDGYVRASLRHASLTFSTRSSRSASEIASAVVHALAASLSLELSRLVSPRFATSSQVLVDRLTTGCSASNTSVLGEGSRASLLFERVVEFTGPALVNIEEAERRLHEMQFLPLFFTHVFTDGERMVIQYHRTSCSSNPRRMQRVAKLLKTRPRVETVAQLQARFGVSDAAVSDAMALNAESKDRAFVQFEPCIVVINFGSPTSVTATIMNASDDRFASRIQGLLEVWLSDAPDARRLFPRHRPETRSRGSRRPRQDAAAVEGPEGDGTLSSLLDAFRRIEDDAERIRSTAVEEDDGVVFDGDAEEYVISMLKDADPMFAYPSSKTRRGYSTLCAFNTKRQPVAVTVDELAKFDPASHTGALVGHGSTAERAARNAYLCPYVWCPKSRVPMSREQFEASGRQCPDEGPPIVFEGPYFQGRDRYIGFLEAKIHPNGIKLPCCFIKPKLAASQAIASVDKVLPQNYIGTDTAKASPGRFAVLPESFRSKCGKRADGSGTLKRGCFVHMGMPAASQSFLGCMAFLLETPLPGGDDEDDSGRTPEERMCHLIAERLEMRDFLTLNGGRLARRWVERSIDDGAAEEEDLDGGGTAAPRSLSERRDALLRAAHRAYVEDLRTPSGLVPRDPYNDGLLDLLSRPLDWINPHHANVLVLERAQKGDAANNAGGKEGPKDGGPSYSTDLIRCPYDASGTLMAAHAAHPGWRATSSWRRGDPVVIAFRSDQTYEPILWVEPNRSPVKRLSTADHPPVRSAVEAFLWGCREIGGDDADADAAGALLAALRSAGRPAVAQLADHAMRLAGFQTADGTFVPVLSARPVPILAGGAGDALELRWVADLFMRPPPRAAARGPALPDREAASQLLSWLADAVGRPGLRVAGEIDPGRALVLESGHVVPLEGFHRDGDGDGDGDGGARGAVVVESWLAELNAFVGQRTAAAADEPSVALSGLHEARAEWRSQLREALDWLRRDVGASVQVASLRQDVQRAASHRRRELADMIRRLRPDLVSGSGSHLSDLALADRLLFGKLSADDDDLAPSTDRDAILWTEGPGGSGGVSFTPRVRVSPPPETPDDDACFGGDVSSRDEYSRALSQYCLSSSGSARLSVDDLVRIVQNRLLERVKALPRGAALTTVLEDGTLGHLAAGRRTPALVDTILREMEVRGPSYVASTFERTEIDRALGR